jgi:hypothetical protein
MKVSRLTFADQLDGFAYDCALFVTHDGGTHWRQIDLGGFVSALAASDGDVYAIVTKPRADGGKLMRSPVGRNDWVTVSAAGDVLEPDVVAHRDDVFVQSVNNRLLISRNRGASFTRDNTVGFGIPCTIQEVTMPVVWAFCSGGTSGHVMRSINGGHSFRLAEGGREGAGASGEYHGAVFAAVTSRTAIVGFGQLLRTTDAGRNYKPVGPAGLEWECLTFADARAGIALAAPPATAPTGSRVYYTSDGGLTYRPVRIRSTGQR